MRSRAILGSCALLLAGCAGAPATSPQARRSPLLALSAPEAPDEPLDIPPGLGPSVPVTRIPPEGQRLSFTAIDQGTTPHGVAGLFVLGIQSDRPAPPGGVIGRHDVRTHGCLLRGNPSCNYLRLGSREADGAVRWRPLIAVPSELERVMLGRDVAYVRAEGPSADLLAVRSDGQTSVWMPFPEEPTAAESATWILADDQPVFAYRIDQEIVLTTRATAAGAPLRIPFASRFVWLDYETPLAETSALARKGARFAYRLTLTTSQAASGDPEPGIVAAWIEFVLPKVVPKSLGGADDHPWVGIGMQVPRRLHLARISLDGHTTDHAELSPAETRALLGEHEDGYLVPPGSMSARPAPGGFVIENAWFDGKLKPRAGSAPDPPGNASFPGLEAEALQRVCAAGYDAAAREGLVVACEAEVAFAQRFDGRGRLVGAPWQLPGGQAATLAPRGLVRLAEGWVGATSEGERVLGLSGTLTGLRIEVPHDAEAGAFTAISAQEAGVDLFFVNDRGGAVRRVRVELASRLAKAPVTLAEPVDVASSFVRSLASPRIINDPRGGQWLIAKGEEGYRAQHRTSDGRIDVVRELGKAVALDLSPVFNDVVAVLRRSAQDDELAGVWLGDGRALALPNGKPSRTAPLLAAVPGQALFVLPSAAPAVPLPEAVVEALFACDGVFATGPRSAVLVCAEPASDERLGRRVTLRALGVEVVGTAKAN